MPSTSPPQTLDERAHQRLRELVEADGRTQRAIAAAAGIHQSHLSGLILGRKLGRLDTVARVLTALGKSWGDLD